MANKANNGNGMVIMLSGNSEPYVQNQWNLSTGRRWIWYDIDDLYPQRMLKLLRSSVHDSIVQMKSQLIVGGGLVFDEEEPGLKMFLNNINPEYDANELVAQTALDLVLFGGFSWQVKWSINRKRIVAVKHVPFSKVRRATPDATGETDSYFIVNYVTYPTLDGGWYYSTDLNATEYPGFGTIEDLATTQPEILYCYNYTPLIDFYPMPDYFGGINYINLDIIISEFMCNNAQNGFIPSGIIGLPDTPSDEEDQKLIQELINNYSGPEAAGRVFLMKGGVNPDGQTITMPQFTPISTSNNADIYNASNEIAMQRIISAHRLSSPTLAGLSGTGGLGGNASEISTAYELFYESIISGYQSKILKQLNRILQINNPEWEVQLGYTLPLKNVWTESVLAGLMSLNEKREMAGLSKIDTPQADVIPGSVKPLVENPEATPEPIQEDRNIINFNNTSKL